MLQDYPLVRPLTSVNQDGKTFCVAIATEIGKIPEIDGECQHARDLARSCPRPEYGRRNGHLPLAGSGAQKRGGQVRVTQGGDTAGRTLLSVTGDVRRSAVEVGAESEIPAY